MACMVTVTTTHHWHGYRHICPVGLMQIQCAVVIMWRDRFSIIHSPKSSPPGRARFGVSFVSSKPDLCPAAVIAVLYVHNIICTTLRYNDIRLYRTKPYASHTQNRLPGPDFRNNRITPSDLPAHNFSIWSDSTDDPASIEWRSEIQSATWIGIGSEI